MKNKNKNILNSKLLELNSSVIENLAKLDKYLEVFLDNNNKDDTMKSRIKLYLKHYPNFFVDYKNLYKLKLEINMLLELKENEEIELKVNENEEIELSKDCENEVLNDDNIDLLKEINSLIYEKEFVFYKKLKNLQKVVKYINHRH